MKEFYNDCLTFDKKLNGQRLGARKPKNVYEQTELRGLKATLWQTKRRWRREESKRKQKTESKRESLCTL